MTAPVSKAKAKAPATNEAVVTAGGETVASVNIEDRTVQNMLTKENESRSYLEI